MSSISLNKFISDTGYCSRREADRLIEAGRVMLNHEIAVTGNRYSPGDEVVVDGSILKPIPKEKKIILAFNKPTGITTTTDTNIPGNIISFIQYPKRIFPIGRLDKDSQGLIFLTNDGDLVNKILRAGNKHEKEYSVRVHKPIDGLFLKNMSDGVRIEGKKTLPCRIRQTGKQTFNIILVQGLNRQIRKMCEALGYTVTFLQRVRIMHIPLGTITIGKWRHLSEPEIEQLEKSLKGSTNEKKPIKTVQEKVAKAKKEIEYKEKKMAQVEKRKNKSYREFRKNAKKK